MKTTPRQLTLTLAMAGVATLGTVGTAFAADYPPVPQDAAVGSSDVSPGDCTPFSGGGFAPGSDAGVGDSGDSLGSAPAGSDGAFHSVVCFGPDGQPALKAKTSSSHGSALRAALLVSPSVVAPMATSFTTTAACGVHHLTASGVTSTGAVRAISADVTVACAESTTGAATTPVENTVTTAVTPGKSTLPFTGADSAKTATEGVSLLLGGVVLTAAGYFRRGRRRASAS